MKRLLALGRRGAARCAPGRAPAAGDGRGRWRRRIINEALRPPEATADWLAQIAAPARGGARRRRPLRRGPGRPSFTARSEEETAAAAALLLRETLETPGRTAALVTPDPALARRVRARLARWGVAAGLLGRLLAVRSAGGGLARWSPAWPRPADPVSSWPSLKHPLDPAGPGAGGAGGGRRTWRLRPARPRPRDVAVIARPAAQAAERWRRRPRRRTRPALRAALTAALDLVRGPSPTAARRRRGRPGPGPGAGGAWPRTGREASAACGPGRRRGAGRAVRGPD